MPPCPLRTLTGVPCPFCGMTRGSLALLRGDVLRSLALNPGALLLVLALGLAIAVVVRRPHLTFPTWLPFAVVAALWSFQLFKYATGRPL